MRSKGQDAKIKLEKRAKELKYIKDLEKKFDVVFSPEKEPKVDESTGDNDDG